MRCNEAQKQSSDYLDSELSPERSAAVRGHLRVCEACQQIFQEERLLIDAASAMPELDPPDAIWQGIQARIAEAEVDDSMTSPVVRWLRWRWRPLAGATLATAALAGFVLFRSLSPASLDPVAESKAPSSANLAPSDLAPSMKESHAAMQLAELAEADQQYLQTIENLRGMLEEDRPLWTKEETAVVDTQLAQFRKEAVGTRMAMVNGQGDTRDQLYAGYRSEISFLQEALTGEFQKSGEPQ